MKEVTLVFLVNDDSILLAMKKRGFGAGKWNGAGGKVEKGETLQQAAIRECQEEIFVTPKNLEYVGLLDFFLDEFDQRCHIYLCDDWEGNPKESDEMAPAWYPKSDIPYDKMWEDDQHWLPLVLAGKKIRATFTFEGDKMLSHKITEVTSI